MTKDTASDFKFGVEDLADKLGIEPASARIKLRNAGIKKANGNSYGWKTKADLDAIVEKLKSAAPKPAAKKDDKKTDKKAPAKAAPKAKDAPKKKAA